MSVYLHGCGYSPGYFSRSHQRKNESLVKEKARADIYKTAQHAVSVIRQKARILCVLQQTTEASLNRENTGKFNTESHTYKVLTCEKTIISLQCGYLITSPNS